MDLENGKNVSLQNEKQLMDVYFLCRLAKALKVAWFLQVQSFWPTLKRRTGAGIMYTIFGTLEVVLKLLNLALGYPTLYKTMHHCQHHR